MSLIKPFRALYYNPELVRDLSKVVCPPYDITDKKEDKFFKKMSPYNFCNILKVDDKHDYSYLANTFERWIDKRVLIEDDKPCFYLYEQNFYFENKIHKRVGLLGLLRIDKEGVIFPHEYTFGTPRKDRYYIIKKLKANLSPIFVIVPGRIGPLSSSYESYRSKRPIISFTDFSGIKNRVWRIDSGIRLRGIEASFRNRHLFIADGHHRFEVAYRYFKAVGAEVKDACYILAYFTDSYSGLLILPTHRVVKLNIPFDAFLNKISKYCDITECDKGVFRQSFNKAEPRRMIFGLYDGKTFYLLRLKSIVFSDKIFEEAQNAAYKNLDVYMLHKFILPKVKKRDDIVYTHSMDEAIKMSKGGRVSFILHPTPLKGVFNMARKGHRLPQKSTYFYPKLLSGIVARRIGL